MNTQQIINNAYEYISDISDIQFEMRGKFETYVSFYLDIPIFAIGYNAKTNQYGFKRYEAINMLYQSYNLNKSEKPDYAKLYQHAKDTYIMQAAYENIQHLYDL